MRSIEYKEDHFLLRWWAPAAAQQTCTVASTVPSFTFGVCPKIDSCSYFKMGCGLCRSSNLGENWLHATLSLVYCSYSDTACVLLYYESKLALCVDYHITGGP